MRLYAPIRILRTLRKRRRWSYRDLAERLRCDPSLICRIELGERGLTVDRLIDYARVFKMRPGELLDAIAEDRDKGGWRRMKYYFGTRTD
jgi:transcriptional regulator with XRE-family HTH domain